MKLNSFISLLPTPSLVSQPSPYSLWTFVVWTSCCNCNLQTSSQDQAMSKYRSPAKKIRSKRRMQNIFLSKMTTAIKLHPSLRICPHINVSVDSILKTRFLAGKLKYLNLPPTSENLPSDHRWYVQSF